jgi:hypothetical protein
MTKRILSFAMKKMASDTYIEMYQQYKDTPNPTLTYTIPMGTKFDDSWVFVWVSYNFYLMKYTLNIYSEPDHIPFVLVEEECPTTINVKNCDGGQIPRPFLRKPNMNLYVA